MKKHICRVCGKKITCHNKTDISGLIKAHLRYECGKK